MRGLPPLLERLVLLEPIKFEEGFRYDCPYLKELEVYTMRGLPEEFVSSVAQNLNSLEVWISDGESLRDFLGMATNLHALRINDLDEDVLDFSIIPIWIRELYIRVRYFVPKPLQTFPNLKKLCVFRGVSIDELLSVMPALENLMWGETEDFIQPSGVYPQVKNLGVLGFAEEELYGTKWRLDAFPNLVTFELIRLNFMEAIDFSGGTVEINLSGRFGFGSVSYKSLKLTKFTVDFTKQDPDIQTKRNLLFDLPVETEEITFVINGEKHVRKMRDVINLAGIHSTILGISFKVHSRCWIGITHGNGVFWQQVWMP